MKKYINISLIYAISAMAGGVFYREFTKWNGFTGNTSLGKVYPHLFLLGMIVFLLVAFGKRNCSGAEYLAHFRNGLGNFGNCRNRTHTDGRRHNYAFTFAEKGCKEINFVQTKMGNSIKNCPLFV